MAQSHEKPSTRNFRIFKFVNPRTKRLMKILKCDQMGCNKQFRKVNKVPQLLRPLARAHRRETFRLRKLLAGLYAAIQSLKAS